MLVPNALFRFLSGDFKVAGFCVCEQTEPEYM